MQASRRFKARDTSCKEAGRFWSNGRIISSRGKKNKPSPVPPHPPQTSLETEPEAPRWIAGFWSPKLWTRQIYWQRISVVITWNIIRLLVLDLPQYEIVKTCMTCGMWKSVWRLFAWWTCLRNSLSVVLKYVKALPRG